MQRPYFLLVFSLILGHQDETPLFLFVRLFFWYFGWLVSGVWVGAGMGGKQYIYIYVYIYLCIEQGYI